MALNISQEGIYYVHSYYPKRFAEHLGVSDEIIAFKNGYPPAIERFTKEMKAVIREAFCNEELMLMERTIAVMPSHAAGQWNEALLEMANRLSKELRILNYSKVLIRETNHEKLTAGGDRSVESHLATIRINDGYKVAGKKFILLDDVTTSGKSLKAAAQILKNAGAEKVMAFAIGNTTSGTLLYDNLF